MEKVVMLSGDNLIVSREVANQVGIDEGYTHLLLEDKVNIWKSIEDRGNVLLPWEMVLMMPLH